MPETWFVVRWPDASRSRCYSPSSAITAYFTPGAAYPVADFLRRSRDGLTRASERVRERYGFACSASAEQLAAIEREAAVFSGAPDAEIVIERFES